ncbi:hypothetical protein BIS44_3703 [Mycobacterium tuberculosis variant bovis BCG]|nr:hypothetical protein BIT17_0368 [Mycobacterium tuberculosis variant bovis]KAF3412977.1 hypothetical protein BIT18_3104 [Mycobacterium tuberculosis variant bovis]KAF3419271.1 hypothetical protein BIS44_3703 [Mycobacterium tuberculosis variant bovis BCG]
MGEIGMISPPATGGRTLYPSIPLFGGFKQFAPLPSSQ